jgi:hypothetical protein
LAHHAQADRAKHEQHAKHCRRLRQHRGACASAKRRLAAPASERAGHISTLALLQQHDQEQEKTDEHVQNRHQVIEHNARLYRALAAPRHNVRERADIEAGAADKSAVDVGQRNQLVNVVRFHAAAIDHVTLIGRSSAKPLS